MYFIFNTQTILILSFTLTPKRNDGDEPDFMAVNPNEWLASTLETCCKRFFSGYSYEICTKEYPRDDDDCIKELYYPDWQGSNEGCISDGK